MKQHKLLKFGNGNRKLGRFTDTFDLVAGRDCPFAKICKSTANRKNGKIHDGKYCEVRCYAASSEAAFLNCRKSHWHNHDLIRSCKTVEEMVDLLLKSMPKDSVKVRPHANGGDFFNENYFLAWMEVARQRPNIHFYCYTKAIPFWLKHKDNIPSNFVLTASFGGTHDHLIIPNGLKYVKIAYSVEHAKEMQLEIDHDDSHAYSGTSPFCLLIHGTQPVGTKANEAWKALTRLGIGGYGVQREKLLTTTIH